MIALALAASLAGCRASQKEDEAKPVAVDGDEGATLANTSAAAATTAEESAPAAGAVDAESSEVLERDPNAIEALRNMGAFLRGQGTFEVHVESSTDEVLAWGQKLQFSGTAALRVRRPSKMSAEVDSDRKQRQFYYDGKTFTLFGERVGYYAQVPAPPTIREMLEWVESHYGIELPLLDLFAWGTENADESAILGAIDVGPSNVLGVETEHYAFRQSDVDYQLWIEPGASPLPRKYVITTLTEPSQPQHVMLLTWTLNPTLDDAAFEFVPPPGALPIVLEEQAP